MTFKEFGEEANIEYKLTVTVNDEETATITGLSEISLLEQLRKVDHAIAEKLQEQFENLPEPIEDETRGYADEN